MQKYIGVKMVEAESMSIVKFKERCNAPLVGDFCNEDGYLVVYPDGYQSWCPKAQFESAYLSLADEDGSVITHDDVIGFVPKDGGLLTSKIGSKTAVTLARCRTGFEITETAACVDPANYDQANGTEIALEKIKDKIWAHLGFVLQWAKNGLG